MPKKSSKKSAKKSTKGEPTRSGFKDVQIAYLTHGVSAVAALGASQKVVRAALRGLVAKGSAAESLEQWCREQFGVGAERGARGVQPPVAGETRTYKAQQLSRTNGGAQNVFLRLPLDILGSKKGSKLRVRFEVDQIVVRRES